MVDISWDISSKVKSKRLKVDDKQYLHWFLLELHVHGILYRRRNIEIPGTVSPETTSNSWKKWAGHMSSMDSNCWRCFSGLNALLAKPRISWKIKQSLTLRESISYFSLFSLHPYNTRFLSNTHNSSFEWPSLHHSKIESKITWKHYPFRDPSQDHSLFVHDWSPFVEPGLCSWSMKRLFTVDMAEWFDAYHAWTTGTSLKMHRNIITQ